MIVDRVADCFSFYVAGTCTFGQTPDVATCSCYLLKVYDTLEERTRKF